MFNSKGNSEISRLRDEMNHLFEQKQAAYDRKEATKRDMLAASKIANSAYGHRQDCATKRDQLWQQMESAWHEVEQAREAMNSAFDRVKSSQDGAQAIWDEAKRAMNDNNRRIDELKAQADSMARDMHNAFDNASSAWNDHDGASAKEYSEEGHRLQDELKGINAEVSSLINENKRILANAKALSSNGHTNRDEFNYLRNIYNQAKARHAQIKADFERAKADFQVAKAEHEKLNADYRQKKALFVSARAEFQKLNQQFKEAKTKFDKAKEQHKSSTDDIARKAGIPSQYLDDVIIKEDTPGCYSIYFGGAGSPDGPGHGHYVLDNGSVTYHRDPYEPHGSQNYDDYKDSPEFRNYQSAAERSEIARLAIGEADKTREPIAPADVFSDKTNRYEVHRGDGTTIFGSKSRDKKFSKKNYHGKTPAKDFYQHGHKGKNFYRSEHDSVAEFAIDSLNSPNHAKPHNASFHYENLTERWNEDGNQNK